MNTAEKFLSDARIVYSNVPDERQSIMLRVKYIQQRHGGTDFNSRACILYELWNKSGKVLLSVLRTVEEITFSNLRSISRTSGETVNLRNLRIYF